jgi:nucleoside-diphosphate-sugar epimerase
VFEWTRVITVTGASGFVGRRLVEALTAVANETIRAFDFRLPTTELPPGVEIVQGSVEEPGDVRAAICGARAVIHLAAFVQPGSREFDKMWRVNVEGTRNVYAASVSAGCKLFLHLSSAGIYGHPYQSRPFREDDIPRPTSPYQRTKWEAEEAVRQAGSQGTIVNVLRPAGIYGAGSYVEIPTYKRIMAKRWAVEPPGGIIVHPTHVEDVVRALVALVLVPATHGTVFNIGGERAVRLSEFEALVASTLGTRRRRVALPRQVAGPLMAVVDPLLGFLGRPNPLRKGINQGRTFSSAVDDSRFRRLYPDVPVVTLQDGLREHIDWAFANRLLA